MKISTLKLYKSAIILFVAMGGLLIVSALCVIFFYADGNIEDYIVSFILILCGVVLSIFPIVLYYKNLTVVFLDNEKCISFSLLKRKLCQIDFSKDVYFSFFNVCFLYGEHVKFIALSNMPFECTQKPNLFKKQFYGLYDRTKIIIFPYESQVAQLINLSDWHCIG